MIKTIKSIKKIFLIALLFLMSLILGLHHATLVSGETHEKAEKNRKGVLTDQELIEKYGDPARYIGIIFGDHRATRADIEGALAVQGNAVHGSSKALGDPIPDAGQNGYNFTIGTGYIGLGQNAPISGTEATFMLGGNYELRAPKGSENGVYGPFYMREGAKEEVLDGATRVPSQATRISEQEMDRYFNILENQSRQMTKKIDLESKNAKTIDATLGSNGVSTLNLNDYFIKPKTAPSDATMTDQELKDLLKTFENKTLYPGKTVLLMNINSPTDELYITGNIPNLKDYDGFIVNATAKNITMGNVSYHAYGTGMINWPFNNGDIQPAAHPGSTIPTYPGMIHKDLPSPGFMAGTGVNALPEFKDLGKIVFNYPNATELSWKNGVIITGSVIAPNAVAEMAGGAVNGQFVVKQLTQTNGFEVHSFGIHGFFWDDQHEKEQEQGQVKLSKVDRETQQGLAGVEFQLEMYNPETQHWTLVLDEENLPNVYRSGEDGSIQITDLDYGNYRLIETKALTGYQHDEGNPLIKEFTIDSTALKDLTGTPIENTKIPQAELTERGQVKLIKVDRETQQGLAGVEFQLEMYDPETKHWTLVLDEENLPNVYRSGEDGSIQITDLDYGNYRLIETKALNGYEYDPNHPVSKEFTIESTALKDLTGIPMENTRMSESSEKEKLPTVDLPITGDSGLSYILIISCILSLVLGVVIFLKKRRQKNQD